MVAITVPPQDIGVINGLVEYPEQNLLQSNLRSIIHLKMVTVEMSGDYTCTISTLQEECSTRTKMIVYGNFEIGIKLMIIQHDVEYRRDTAL